MKRTLILGMVLTLVGCAGMQKQYSAVTVYVTRDGECNQESMTCGPVRMRGTGWFVERNLIMTAGHLVRNSATDEVEIGMRGVSEKGHIEYVSNKSDLALISVEGTGERPFKLCDEVSVDDLIYIRTYNGILLTQPPGIILTTKNGDIVSTVRSVPGNSGAPTLRGRFWSQCVVGTLWGSNYKISGHIGLPRMRECLADYQKGVEE